MRRTLRIALGSGPNDRAPLANDVPVVDNSRRQKLVRLYLTATLLLSLMLSLYIWQYTKMVEVKLRLEQLEKKRQSIETSNAVVAAEISKLTALDRIERIAREELGMVVPKRLCYLPMGNPAPVTGAKKP